MEYILKYLIINNSSEYDQSGWAFAINTMSEFMNWADF